MCMAAGEHRQEAQGALHAPPRAGCPADPLLPVFACTLPPAGRHHCRARGADPLTVRQNADMRTRLLSTTQQQPVLSPAFGGHSHASTCTNTLLLVPLHPPPHSALLFFSVCIRL